MKPVHMCSEAREAKHRDATAFVNALSECRESRFNSMSKSEIKVERLNSRGLMPSKTSGKESLAACHYSKAIFPKAKQETLASNEFIYELAELAN